MKTSSGIGVGVIGASPSNPGWAIAAHIPAIRALSEYELRAVSTSRADSALAASKAFGVPGFDNHEDLIAHPGVDLVVVTVKVPRHHELVSAALRAGKMVFSEWPLGNGLDEAVDLASQARVAGVRTAVGLQARFSPVIREARSLVANGYIGEVLGTTLVGSGFAWGGATDRAHAYMFDAANGATTLSVPTMHALEAINFVLGDFASVTASSAIRHRFAVVAEDQSSIAVSAADHIAIAGTLENGAVASVFYRGGTSRGDNLRWEINGSRGDLVITSALGNLQVADLKLEGAAGNEMRVAPLALSADTDEYGAASEGIGANVLRAYAHFARDLREGTQSVPDFDYAVRRHHLLAAIEKAASSGNTQRLAQ